MDRTETNSTEGVVWTSGVPQWLHWLAYGWVFAVGIVVQFDLARPNSFVDALEPLPLVMVWAPTADGHQIRDANMAASAFP
jgi:hypothetical protein